MRKIRTRSAALIALATGALLVGGGTAIAVAQGSGMFDNGEEQVQPWTGPHPEGEVFHRPSLLHQPGEDLRLEFRFICPPWLGNKDCNTSGHVHYTLDGVAWRDVELKPGDDPQTFSAVVPSAASTEVKYWAEFTLATSVGDRTLAIPRARSDGPWVSATAALPIKIDLAPTEFAAFDTEDFTAMTASWGSGAGQVGLDKQVRFGPSAFDVAANGALTVLDHVNGRFLTHSPGGTSAEIPATLQRGYPDLTVLPDGRIAVLNSRGPGRNVPTVDLFRPTGGAPIASTEVPSATTAVGNLRAAGSDLVVKTMPSGLWTRVITDGVPIPVAKQVLAPLEGLGSNGRELVAEVLGDHQVRIAIKVNGIVLRSFVITSSKLMGPIQLADFDGVDPILVLTEFDDSHVQYRLLRLGLTGITKSKIVPREDWAEANAGAMFRVRNGTVYQLQSSPSGIRIVGYRMNTQEASR